MRKNKSLLLICGLLLLSSCYKETIIEAGEGLEDWSISTHSSYASPNYSTVFPQDQVNRFDITISSSETSISFIE